VRVPASAGAGARVPVRVPRLPGEGAEVDGEGLPRFPVKVPRGGIRCRVSVELRRLRSTVRGHGGLRAGDDVKVSGYYGGHLNIAPVGSAARAGQTGGTGAGIGTPGNH